MYVLPELPFAYDALEPKVSELTMRTHHDKHHKAYVDATNTIVGAKGGPGEPLESVVRRAKQDGETKLFNQSGQAWNHAFFWNSLTPEKGAPEGELAAAISKAFGGLDGFKTKFVEEGAGHFASGWVWLAADEGRDLMVISTHDADTALIRPGLTPLLVCDVWEHAYYLDYKNVRKDFLTAFVEDLANWSFAGRQFAAAQGSGTAWTYPEPTHA